MATEKRTGPDRLSHFARLVEKPDEHHVLQALRIIDAENAEKPRLGSSRRPHQDSVRLGQEPHLAFPPSTITDFKPGTDKVPGRLTNRFFGFFGPHGPLPLHLTDYARDRIRNHRDDTFVGFANMLTHRLMSLFYRAWRSGQPAPSFDRGNDVVEGRVAAIAGYRGEAFQKRDAMPDLTRRHFAAHLSQGSKNPEGLISILSGFFGVDVRMEQFIGSWLELEPDDCWELGSKTGLGQTTSIGTRVWSRAAKFRLCIGPLDRETYERFLPGSEGSARLEAIVRNYVGDTLDWEAQLILRGEDVPRSMLGGETRLGQTSWVILRNEGETRPDAGDFFLTPRRSAA